MKNALTSLSVVLSLHLLVAPSAAAKTPTLLGGFGGSLELPEAELMFRPVLYTSGWSHRESVEDGFTKPAANGHDFYFNVNRRDTEVQVPGHAAFAPDGDGVSATWEVTTGVRTNDKPCVVASFFLPKYEAATFATDGRKVVLSDAAPFGDAFRGKVSDLSVTDGTGRTVVRVAFQEKVEVLLLKVRDWGLAKYELRMKLDGTPDRRRLAARISAGEPLSFREEGPVVIRPGADWIPCRVETDVLEGSALDFTRFRGTDMPAGCHGRLLARDGRFEFEKKPGEAQRFYGINVCFTANVPDEETSRQFAKMLRKLGYNAIRFHHHETSLVKADAAKGSTELDPAAMRKFDALAAACIENGIYLTTDLFVSRKPISYRSLGLDLDGDCEMSEYKFLVAAHEGAYSNYVAFARNFLGHVNAFTGRRYADEPALALLSFVNEGNLAGTQWSARKFRLLKDYSKDALAALERKFAQRVTAFLREEMGCKALLTNMNNYFWNDDPAAEGVRATAFDYADDHFYVDHPRALRMDWTLPSSCPNTNPLIGSDMGAQRLTSTRPLGLPFTITEYNFSAPGRFRGVGGILTGALGARQDWGGLLRFAWTHGKEGLVKTKPLGYFDMSGDPLGLAAERASICLFLRRDLPTAEGTCAFLLPPAKAGNFKDNPGSFAPYWACDWAAWYAKLGTLVADRAPEDVQVLATYPDKPAREDLDALRTRSTGGVTIDERRGSFRIETPRTVGGFAECGTIAAGPFAADIGDVPATVWASTLDGEPVARSKHLLLTHLTDVQNTNIRYADAGKRILLGWGGLPHLMRAGRAKVSLALSGSGWKVRALASNGRPVREVPVCEENGRVTFTADVAADAKNATWLYELIRE